MDADHASGRAFVWGQQNKVSASCDSEGESLKKPLWLPVGDAFLGRALSTATQRQAAYVGHTAVAVVVIVMDST